MLCGKSKLHFDSFREQRMTWITFKENFKSIKTTQIIKSECRFFLEEISFWGDVINGKGVSLNQEKVKCIKDWSTLKDYEECQRFLGLKQFPNKLPLKN